jgi:hypothetical protein
MPRPALRSLIVALLAAGALAASSCGGAVNPLAAAVTKTSSTRGVKLDLRAEMTLPQGGSMTMSGGGVMDMAGHRGRLAMRVEAPGLGLPDDMRLDQVIDDKVLYMRMRGLPRGLPGGKEWFKVDLTRIAEAAGIDMGGLGSSSSDPAQTLRWLRASDDVEEVGPEVVRGTSTKRYRAVIELDEVADKLPEAHRKAARKAIEQLRRLGGPERVPTEVWIGDDGLLRRQTISWEQSLPGAPGTMTLAMTLELYDYGTRVRIERPDANDVLDLTDAAGSGLERQLR